MAGGVVAALEAVGAAVAVQGAVRAAPGEEELAPPIPV